jgi:hypothetical protein
MNIAPIYVLLLEAIVYFIKKGITLITQQLNS